MGNWYYMLVSSAVNIGLSAQVNARFSVTVMSRTVLLKILLEACFCCSNLIISFYIIPVVTARVINLPCKLVGAVGAFKYFKIGIG